MGHDIGRYHITEQLGQGGMATVYKAYDTRLERDVAIKVIRRQAFSPEIVDKMLKRFEREAKALARLNHPNIVSIFDYGEYEGSPYLVMQYIEAGTLKQRLAGRPIAESTAARLILPVARALEYAHSKGIVHRDVKPANMLVTENGDVMLSDFGIAKLLDAEDGSTLTGTNVGVGTPEYMAPEQGSGRNLDGRADIYSLGVVFYELVTGHKPYTADTPMAVIIKQATDPLPDPKKYVPGIGREAERLIYKSLAKNADDRYQGAGEMASALEKLVGLAPAQEAEPAVKTVPEVPLKKAGQPARPVVAGETYDVITSGSPQSPARTRKIPGVWIGVGVLMALALVLAVVGFGALTVFRFAQTNSQVKTQAVAVNLVTLAPTALVEAAAPAAPTETAVPLAAAAPAAPPTLPSPGGALPRNETLYFNGQQWGNVQGWNPYSTDMNNGLAIAQQDNARVTMFETPYLYNMVDGKFYPLLADGDFKWNDSRTEITFKLKKAARWNDGTAVTAEDVAYTWATHLKYDTNVSANYGIFIDSISAVDDQTVLIKARLDNNGRAVNPLQVAAYLSSGYVIQKAWTQKLEARVGGDAARFKADPAEDVVSSGPYKKFFADQTRVVLVRDESYWGQDASMWGKLPTPRFLAHVIYKNNDAGLAALKAGEVDVSQQYNGNVQDLRLKDNLPISTYFSGAPYQLGASLPTAFFNLGSNGLDQAAVRKAIAMAVDYDTLIANAMTNQSPTFAQVPRSLMNPTAGEQALYDEAALKDLQWTGNDIDGANKLLDAAGIKKGPDGWRVYKGKKLSYKALCPSGWLDWQAAIETVAAAGKKIGIDIQTDYPDWSVYQTVVTDPTSADYKNYDIFMMWSDGAGPAQPWGRINHLMNSVYAGTKNNWSGNWNGYRNPAADKLINAIPGETDPATIKADYTALVKMYLTDVPSFTLMYRPQSFQTVNESVWTGFPRSDDGLNIPPLDLTDGYSIAGLYHLSPVRK